MGVLPTGAGGGDSGPPLELVRDELQRLLTSPAFADAPRLRSLLSFLVEQTICGHTEELKESVIAVEVFGRPPDFDPRSDSVVRVQVRNLRAKLRNYYGRDGQEDAVHFHLPPGSYVPVFQANGKEARRGEAPPPAALLTRRRVAIGLAAVGLIILVAALVVRAGIFAPAARRSIAILPFLNLAGGADNDYIVDGFAEDVTTGLARARNLRVAARTSAFRFRGSKLDVREIARQLGVAAVLEGAIQSRPEGFKVTAQLIDANSGYHLWSGMYEQPVGRLPQVEADVQRDVADALGVRLAGPSSTHVAPPEARDAYWRGRYLRASFPKVPESVPYFERAVAIDPQFAEAWASLALAHSIMSFHLAGPVEKETAKAKEAARKALGLDETQPEAHCAVGLLAFSFDHDLAASERAYRRAFELNPSYASGRRGFALVLSSQGRFQEAIDQLQLAQQLDPMSVLSSNDLATNLYLARRYDEALKVARHHLKMDPAFFPARLTTGACEAARGRLPEAVSALEKAAEESGRAFMVLGPLGNVLARVGNEAQAHAILRELQVNPQMHGYEVAVALVSTGLGQKKQAIESLRQGALAHVTDVAFIGVDPMFDPLRKEPEFQALRASLGLSGENSRTH